MRLSEFIVVQIISAHRLLRGSIPERVVAELPDQPQCLGKRDDVNDRRRAGLEPIRCAGPDDPVGEDKPGGSSAGLEWSASWQCLAIDCQCPYSEGQPDVLA